MFDATHHFLNYCHSAVDIVTCVSTPGIIVLIGISVVSLIAVLRFFVIHNFGPRSTGCCAGACAYANANAMKPLAGRTLGHALVRISRSCSSVIKF